MTFYPMSNCTFVRLLATTNFCLSYIPTYVYFHIIWWIVTKLSQSVATLLSPHSPQSSAYMETVIIALCHHTIQNEYNSTFSTQLQFHTTVIQLSYMDITAQKCHSLEARFLCSAFTSLSSWPILLLVLYAAYLPSMLTFPLSLSASDSGSA